MAMDLVARIEESSETMVDSYSSKIKCNGEETSNTDIKSSGYCFLSEEEVMFKRSRLELVVQLDLVMCKNHPGCICFECIKLSCRAAED